MNTEERVAAIANMEATVAEFYRRAVGIGNHPFLEFAGVMTAYVNSCRRAHEQGIDFSQCNRHTGQALPMESFEIAYLTEKLDCIFDGRIVGTQTEPADQHDYRDSALRGLGVMLAGMSSLPEMSSKE